MAKAPPPGDQIPRTHEDGSVWNAVPTYREGDVTKVRQSLGPAGMPRNPAGFIREAKQAASIGDQSERMRQKLGTFKQIKPPPGQEHLARYWDARMHNDWDTAMAEYKKNVTSGVHSGGMQKTAYSGNGGLNNTVIPGLGMGGMPKYTDPLNSPTRAGIPTWHAQMPPEEAAMMQMATRAWSRHFYRNHHLVPSLMNIYAKYPFVGIDLRHSDPGIEAEYKTQFFDVLKYDELLPLASLQYWITGEAPMLAEWDDGYGGWSSEEIMNPDHIDLKIWPKPGKRRETYFWLPPEEIVELAKNGDPKDPMFQALKKNYTAKQLHDFREGNPFEIPGEHFSLLRHDEEIGGSRGFPILMRAFPQLMQEEKLNQALQAIAERLYTPFVIAKLGGVPLPDGETWVPDMEDITAFQAYLEMAMVSNHRTMVWHSGVTFENPFGNMQVPNLNEDFRRSDENVAAVFGMDISLVKGGATGAYAATATSAENMMQTLAASQKMWTQWWIKDRMMRVAEERGLYEVQRKGLQMVHPLEKVLETDEETGKTRVRVRQKLATAAIHLESIDWRDEQAIFGNLMQLRQQGVFIPDGLMLQKADPDLEPEAIWQEYEQEQVRKQQIKNNLRQQGVEEEQPGGAGGGAGGMAGGAGRPAGRPAGAPGGGDPRPMGGGAPPQSGQERANQPAPQGQPQPGQGEGQRAASLRVVEAGETPEQPAESYAEAHRGFYSTAFHGNRGRGNRVRTAFWYENSTIHTRRVS